MEKNEKNCQKAQEMTKEELEQVNGGISDHDLKTAIKVLFGR